jgi:hypothetical protein
VLVQCDSRHSFQLLGVTLRAAMKRPQPERDLAGAKLMTTFASIISPNAQRESIGAHHSFGGLGRGD